MTGYRRAVQIELRQIEEQLQRLVEDPQLVTCHREQVRDLQAHVAEAQRALWRVRRVS